MTNGRSATCRKAAARFDPEVVSEIVELAGGRPYYLQKLAYFAFDAAVTGRVTRGEFAVAFERSFASVSQEIFAARWAGMSPIDRQVDLAGRGTREHLLSESIRGGTPCTG